MIADSRRNEGREHEAREHDGCEHEGREREGREREGRERVMAAAANPTSDWARPVGRNSEIWKHFSECVSDREAKKEKIRVRCNHCPALFTYCSSTSNFWRHMKKEHEEILTNKKDTRGDPEVGPSSKSQPLISAVLLKMEKQTRAMVSKINTYRQG